MREVIDQLLTRVTCHLSVFWITQGRPRICCGEKQDKNIDFKEIRFPLNRLFQNSSSRSEFKENQSCKYLRRAQMSGRLPRPSSPAPPSLCPCCRSRKMRKYPRFWFSSNGRLISIVAHPQSSVVAFIPSPSLSACCLLNLSSQGDHLDFSRFFLRVATLCEL